ncbi:MAG: glutamine-hydrolyzing GMP synthase [Bacteroidetes bacterium]|uniref:GMP synthase [glutamine-hydrolyzing] n=1 Tax=Candidatus Cryptobacteroides intestinigallinarum TaxID=2840767 RepID=A0A9D9HJG7_9BACT|nr:glutamine-hydrolyzing GMP synthase [Candidatus Cryptobacteroides intestinigallinarum]
MTEKIIILDSGSQVTQLIGRRLRELNVYCEIFPFNKIPELGPDVKGVILSGSPFSVRDANAPQIDLTNIKGKLPLLGICYGAQYLAHKFGGEVNASIAREYGRAMLDVTMPDSPLLKGVAQHSQVWMSHGDTIARLPEGGEVIASTHDVVNAAFHIKGEDTYAVQFHPEVYHTKEGSKILANFAFGICGCKGDWTPASFIETTIASLKEKIGDDKVILGLSGGVDSTVASVLLHKAIGHNLTCIFVNNGLLRKNEFEDVLASYKDMGLNVIGADASKEFISELAGVTDPEKKRKIIGRLFIETFDKYARSIENARWLAQGTIYPDVIESASVNGPSSTIKSHHNVGGLPEKMDLKIVEPLRSLFKDEVRRVGRALGIKDELINRHPFPGPSLGIRILGDVTEEKLRILREADDIFIRGLREYQLEGNRTAIEALAGPGAEEVISAADPTMKAKTLYEAIWQAGAILLPVRSVGVMGDERTYENTIALRAVISTDGMTADWVHLPYDFLAKTSNDIINKVRGVNRVVYDISSKPPATIEWE